MRVVVGCYGRKNHSRSSVSRTEVPFSVCCSFSHFHHAVYCCGEPASHRKLLTLWQRRHNSSSRTSKVFVLRQLQTVLLVCVRAYSLAVPTEHNDGQFPTRTSSGLQRHPTISIPHFFWITKASAQCSSGTTAAAAAAAAAAVQHRQRTSRRSYTKDTPVFPLVHMRHPPDFKSATSPTITLYSMYVFYQLDRTGSALTHDIKCSKLYTLKWQLYIKLLSKKDNSKKSEKKRGGGVLMSCMAVVA